MEVSGYPAVRVGITAIFGRNNGSSTLLRELVASPGLDEKAGGAQIVNNRYIVQTGPVDADLDNIKAALCSWIDLLAAALKAKQLKSLPRKE